MTGTSMMAKIVRVKIEHDPTGMFIGTSTDLKGLLIAESTREGVHAAIPRAISDLYLAYGVRVVVTPVEPSAETEAECESPWVAVPTEVAKAALAAAGRA